ncbi:L-threonylcarbamoyladenylate synthase [Paenibacillus sp. D2_2]|uniref:L-threonylcarbamoyladenylate synthase n=1 Tax=Paenibacillus sp. D2_2 TaxID=3073092 RepID=UPI002814ED44|nr:L-threonylcarbamoyladenylate synthase [Paenibacillus sp. D2_2]WMT40716.1 L-threonylcarbamoyladenylate synthase [Paenibacillus sp. D2_2]
MNQSDQNQEVDKDISPSVIADGEGSTQAKSTCWWDVRSLVAKCDGEGESKVEGKGYGRDNERQSMVQASDPSAEVPAESDLERADEQILEAGRLLAAGGVVAFPTETVYGLGADARNTAAVEAVFAAKGRPSDNPLIVHIADMGQLDGLVTEVNETARRLMEAFWPGPLTLVLPVAEGAVSPRVTAGLSTVGVRMPANDIALRVIAAAGCPVAAPSANLSGRPSPTLASHVGEDLDGRIDGIVDGGPTGVGLESTVAEVGRDGVVTVLRPGGITAEQLARFAAGVRLDAALRQAGGGTNIPAAPRAPGMKYAHYAPQGAMHIVSGAAPEAVAAKIQAELDAAAQRGEVTGVLAFDEHIAYYRADLVLSLGSLAALETAAHRLYAALRHFDARGVTYIMAESCSEEGLGSAVMNRLSKAAGHHVIHV